MQTTFDLPGKVLRLTLTKQWFEVMVTGEKMGEYRRPSKFIMDRLYNKDGPTDEASKPTYGTPKQYDYVHFTNGYGAHLPWFASHYKGFVVATHDSTTDTFANGHAVQVAAGDYIICLGQVVARGNLKTPPTRP